MLLELYILSFTAIKLRSSTENANNTERALTKDHNGVTSFLSIREAKTLVICTLLPLHHTQ